MARAGPRPAAIEHGDSGAPGEPPRNAEADYTCADNGDARLS
jgi:hypothetical protein